MKNKIRKMNKYIKLKKIKRKQFKILLNTINKIIDETKFFNSWINKIEKDIKNEQKAT